MSAIYQIQEKNCEIYSPDKLRKLIKPDKSIFSKPKGIGAAIGYLCNQSGMNLLLNDLDHYIVDDLKLNMIRFVDDMLFVDTDKDKLLQSVQKIRDKAAEVNCKLSSTKFYLQPATHGVEFLGYHIRYNRLHLNGKIVYRMVGKIKDYNNHVDLKHAQQFQDSINSYLGMTKISNDTRLINQVLMEINARWLVYFNFNGKRRCFQFRNEYKLSARLQKEYNYKGRLNKRRSNRMAERLMIKLGGL